MNYQNTQQPQQKTKPSAAVTIVTILIIVFIILFATKSIATVTAGHVGVVSLFGKINDKELSEGFHIINPLSKVKLYNCQNREFSLTNVSVSSQDMLITSVDLTVQWRVDPTQAAEASRHTGSIEKLESVYLTPTLRSLLRESGKNVKTAEEFYSEKTQQNMQHSILAGSTFLSDKGIIIEKVLIRIIELPKTIRDGIEYKKRQQQLADQEIARLKYIQAKEKQKNSKD